MTLKQEFDRDPMRAISLAVKRLKPMDLKLQSLFKDWRSQKSEPINIARQHKIDLGNYEGPVTPKGPNWVQIAMNDLQRLYGDQYGNLPHLD